MSTNYFLNAIRGQALLSNSMKAQAKLRAETDKIGFTTSYSKASIDRDEIAFVDHTRFQTGKGKKQLEILYRNSWAVFKALNVRANILSSRGLKVICKTDKAKTVLKKMLFRMHPSRPMQMLQESFRLRSLNADIFGNAFDELLFTPTGTKEKPKSVSEATDMLGFSVMHPMNTDFIRENFDSLITMEGNKPKGYVWRQDPLQESDSGIELEIARVGHLKYNVIGDELLGMSSIEPMFKTAERLLKIEEGVTQGILTHGNPLHDVIVGDESHPPTKSMIDDTATAVQGLNTKSEYVHPPWIRVGQIESFSLGKSPNYMQPFITAIAACTSVPEFILLGRGEGTNKATAQSMINFIHQAILPLQNAQALYFEEQILAPLMKLNKIEEIPKVEWNEILPRDPNDYANIIKVFSELVRDEKPVVSGEELREMGGLTNETSFKTTGTSIEMAKGSEKEPVRMGAQI